MMVIVCVYLADIVTRMSLSMESSTDPRFSSTQPYTVLDRKERSRELAQKRRSTYKTLMQDLADKLPFSKDIVSQVDYRSRLRLALCFFRAKNLLKENLTNLANGKYIICAMLCLITLLSRYCFADWYVCRYTIICTY